MNEDDIRYSTMKPENPHNGEVYFDAQEQALKMFMEGKWIYVAGGHEVKEYKPKSERAKRLLT